MSHALADVVLVIHFAFVAFVVGGLAATWIGAAAGWRWVRNFWFRVLHLAAICFVAAEALLGVMCPLTVWEDALRGRGSEVGFIARWIRSVMFYEVEPWVFTAAYIGFASVVALTLWFVPPRRGSARSRPGR
jgi:polyferredoxin